MVYFSPPLQRRPRHGRHLECHVPRSQGPAKPPGYLPLCQRGRGGRRHPLRRGKYLHRDLRRYQLYPGDLRRAERHISHAHPGGKPTPAGAGPDAGRPGRPTLRSMPGADGPAHAEDLRRHRDPAGLRGRKGRPPVRPDSGVVDLKLLQKKKNHPEIRDGSFLCSLFTSSARG